MSPVKHKGEDLTGKVLKLSRSIRNFAQTEKVRIDMLRRFGYYSARNPTVISANTYLGTANVQTKSQNGSILAYWINGETGGYLRVCTEGRNWFETDFPNWMKEPMRSYTLPRTAAKSTALILLKVWRLDAYIAATSTWSTTA